MVDVELDTSLKGMREKASEIVASSSPQGKKKKSPKEKMYTTLPAFLIEVLRKHGGPISVEELIPIVLANLSVLRKSDGRKYTCAKTNRVVKSALYSVPAFLLTSEGWTLNEAEAQVYKNKTLRNINHRLGKIETRKFDVDKAFSLLVHRVQIEENEPLRRLIEGCSEQTKAREKRRESLGTELLGLRTGEAVVRALGAERVAGMCVMYHLLKSSKAMTVAHLLPNEESFRRKLSNLSLGMLYLENKLKNEITAVSSQQQK